MTEQKQKEYRIKLMARDDRYGACERCGKRCIPHYAQQWRNHGTGSTGWVSAGFGHVDCLRNAPWDSCSVVED